MSNELGSDSVPPIKLGMRRIERREWWLWPSTVLIAMHLSLRLSHLFKKVLHSIVEEQLCPRARRVAVQDSYEKRI
jgi:hypothetical protein